MTLPMSDAAPTKVLGRRVIAYLVDWALLIALLVVPIMSSAVGFDSPPREMGFVPQGLNSISEAHRSDTLVVQTESGTETFTGSDLIYVFDDRSGMLLRGDDVRNGFLLYGGGMILLFVVVQGLTGATIGKLLAGIRTVNDQGQAPGLWRAFLRTILWIVDGAFCGPLIGFIVANASKGNRRVGDMAAKTFVVRSSAMGQPVLIPGLNVAAVPAGGWATAAAPMAPMPGVPQAPAPGPMDAGFAAPEYVTPGLESQAPAASTPAADPSQPQWDPARNAYIAWDATAQQWQQFDDASQQWRPIV